MSINSDNIMEVTVNILNGIQEVSRRQLEKWQELLKENPILAFEQQEYAIEAACSIRVTELILDNVDFYQRERYTDDFIASALYDDAINAHNHAMQTLLQPASSSQTDLLVNKARARATNELLTFLRNGRVQAIRNKAL